MLERTRAIDAHALKMDCASWRNANADRCIVLLRAISSRATVIRSV
jgi:hypothetical protein